MQVIETKLSECVVIKPDIHGDDRGFFFEAFEKSRYKKEAGINLSFVQDNVSRSRRGVLRGMHYQITKPQGKLVSVISGEVFDVAVDIRKGSKTFGQWEGVTLSDKNKKQFWIPPGFAHGFLVLSEYADFYYKCTDFYDAFDEGSFIWSDPSVAISWAITDPILSDKDSTAPLLQDALT